MSDSMKLTDAEREAVEDIVIYGFSRERAVAVVEALFAARESTPTEDAVEDAEARAALAGKWLSASESARKAEHHWPADCLAEAAHMLTAATGDADLRDRVAADGRRRTVNLPVDDLLMALSYEGSDPPEQDAAPAWKAAHDRVLAAIYGPDGSPAPVMSQPEVEQ